MKKEFFIHVVEVDTLILEKLHVYDPEDDVAIVE
jgi:hypothetical protein